MSRDRDFQEAKRAAKWMNQLSSYWNDEVPVRIHSRDIAEDGSPQWHPTFAMWLLRSDITRDRPWRENPEPRVRTTRAFRKLRQKFPREYEVLYRTAILKIPIHETVRWLNDRAMRNNKPERYNANDVTLILIVASDKVASWW